MESVIISFFEQSVEIMITAFQKLYYQRKLEELKERKSRIEEELKQFNFEKVMKQLTDDSLLLLYGVISQKYKNHTRTGFETEDLWKNVYDFIKQYPVILSTLTK